MKKQADFTRKQKKIELAKALSEKIERAKTLAFINYHGLKVGQLNDLRRKIKEAGGELLVAKNTLIKRVLTNHLQPDTRNLLTGPTAILLAYNDEIAPLKIAAESAKTHGLPKFKFGFFGKDFLDTAAIEDLAKIESRQILQSKLAGSLAFPLYNLIGALQANIRNLVQVLRNFQSVSH